MKHLISTLRVAAIRICRLTAIRMRKGVTIPKGALHIGRRVVVTTESDGWRLGGSVLISEGARLSDYATIDAYGGDIIIGRNFYLGRYSLLQGFGKITIGENVMIGPHASIIASSHGFEDLVVPMRAQAVQAMDVSIADNVWVGAGARILGGVSIETGAIIGAGAVVTSDVARNEIRGGVPARVISLRRN